MNTVLSNYGQLCGCPEILKKSCNFFCRGLDIRVADIVSVNGFNTGNRTDFPQYVSEGLL